MKIGVFSVAFSDLCLEETLKSIKTCGAQAVELPTRLNTENPHVHLKDLLSSNEKVKEFLSLLREYDMEISALSCHGNPVHPQKDIAQQDRHDFEQTVLLAEKLGIRRVITFSGSPGDTEGAKYPNWVTCAWPDDFSRILDYQWNDVLLPYWDKAARFAYNHGVDMVSLEMHPGFCVYNPETLLRLRENTSSVIGANFDPSHLFWQGIEPEAAIRKLGSCIFHFHAKDVQMLDSNRRINGVLDTKPLTDDVNRSWRFRTVGYGHDVQVWSGIIRALSDVGYDHVLSIEHEDNLMSRMEALSKASSFLKQIMMIPAKS